MGLFEGRQTRAEKLYSQKKYEEAEKLFDEVVHDRERTHGKDHENTLTSKDRLANTLYQQGKYPSAEKSYYQVVQGRERTLGKDHKHTLTGKYWLAHTLYQQGKYQEAQRIFQEVANARERTLGSGHEDTLASNQWLSNTKWRLRHEPQKAGKPFDKTAHGQEKKTGRYHGDRPNSQQLTNICWQGCC
jgi:tetratricopeptide (TPR) repeat protein